MCPYMMKMWILYTLYIITALILLIWLILKLKQPSNHKTPRIFLILSIFMVIITGVYQLRIHQMNVAYDAAEAKYGNYSDDFQYYLHGDSLASYLDNQPGTEEDIIFDDDNYSEAKSTVNAYKNMRKELSIMKENNTGKYDYQTSKELFDNCTIVLHMTTSHKILKQNNLLK